MKPTYRELVEQLRDVLEFIKEDMLRAKRGDWFGFDCPACAGVGPHHSYGCEVETLVLRAEYDKDAA